MFLLSNASFAQELNAELIPLLEKHRGDVAVMIKNLDTGETFEYHSDVVMPTASLIKFPVLIELYRQTEQGALTLDKPITLQETDKVPGSGILTQHFNAEAVLSLHTIARLMITYSDNTATNLVLDQIGISNVAKTMTEMGFPETQIHSKVFRRDTSIAVERSQKFGLGSTTAKDMVLLLEKLHQRKLLSPNSCEAILAHLLTCDDKSKLARKLPAGVKFYHKTGAVNECRTDAGLLATPKGTIAIAVLTNKNRDNSWTDNNEAELLCAEVGDIVYRWYNPESLTVDSGSAVLKIGSNGILVEALQRALNRQLEPTPSLSVDGDFGPATEKALKDFQVARKLMATGVADSKTWEALGPIELEEADREAEITQELPRKVDAEILSGAPFVSCKAWVIFDKQAGTSIEGNASDQRLEIASTTKMMTAWLVSKFASQHPEVLEERVTFSPRADNTPGSSATIRAGESVTVHELLYGLMLPSGNDAATALAEHFGDRLYGGTAESAPKNSYEKFIAAMNREASELGMKNTSFRNPHGWPHKEHYSSCFDLALLASKLLDSPLLREIVSARQFRCETQSVEGYRRALTWKNTNELLGIEGYIGIKTGTTDAAGACLVSCSVRDNQELIVVTLGSSGSAARYADSRNLHRWGWLKRSGEANAKANDSIR